MIRRLIIRLYYSKQYMEKSLSKKVQVGNDQIRKRRHQKEIPTP